MKTRSPSEAPPSLRDKIIGLGERSVRKSYYPQIQRQLADLEAARQELAESQTRYRSLVENINDVIFSLDVAGKVTYVSPVVESLSGIVPERIVGRPFMEFVHPEDVPALLARFKRALAGEPQPHEFRVRNREGDFRQVRTSSRPLLYAGRVVGLTGVMTDITERKRIEEELERHRLHLEELVALRTRELAQARDAAESANRLKSVFLANMSHELRTPLNAILGFAQIMEMDQRIPDDEHNNLRTINRSGRHLLALINDVLEISRIEAGRLKLQPIAFDLLDILTSLRDIVELRARDKCLMLRMTLSPTLPRFVVGDAGKLRQVLLNLLSNAVKYTEAGEIEFSASADTSDQRTTLQCVIRDTGVGIAAEDLDRIFQPFYQTEYGVTVGEGTGLGLTISREYAQLLGGSLGVESELHRGSTFRLLVPLQLAESPLRTGPAAGLVVGLMTGQPRYRVLVVDDDADSRRLLRELLSRAGFQVRTADNGDQAVEAFQSWQPDFIWMDMRMPVTDGYEATRRIRALPGGGEVKIAALTASAFLEDRDEIMAAGCDDMLSKPLDHMQLFATMASLLGVKYRYAEAPVVVEAGTPSGFGGLPASLREELRRAAHELDVEATKQAIERIRAIQAPLADQAEELASAYRYDRIVTLCDTP